MLLLLLYRQMIGLDGELLLQDVLLYLVRKRRARVTKLANHDSGLQAASLQSGESKLPGPLPPDSRDITVLLVGCHVLPSAEPRIRSHNPIALIETDWSLASLPRDGIPRPAKKQICPANSSPRPRHQRRPDRGHLAFRSGRFRKKNSNRKT